MADPFDIDLEELQKEEEAARQEKASLLRSAGIAENLANRQSMGNFYLGQMNPKQDLMTGAREQADLVGDPWERRKKILEQVRASREGRKAEREDKREMALDDPNSPESKAVYESFAKAGVRVKPGLSASQYSNAYGKAADYALAKFKEEESRKTELAKAGAKTPKGFVRQINPITGMEELVPVQKPLPPDKVLGVNEGNAIPKMLQDVRTTVEGNEDIFGPIAGRLASLNPYDERGQTAESQIRTASQAFGRYMEGGVLRKEDEEKYRKMFPQLGDTPQVAKNKLDIVERLMAEKQNSNLAALEQSGYDIRGVNNRIATPEIPKVLTQWRGGGGSGIVPEAHAGVMQTSFTAEDLEALSWAQNNQKDERAKEIFRRLKAKGL